MFKYILLICFFKVDALEINGHYLKGMTGCIYFINMANTVAVL